MAPPARPKTERKKKTAPAPLAADVAHDTGPVSERDIALRAFAYYCERGCQDGADVDDWLRAERDLLSAPKPMKRRAAR